jgi:transposase-like protein
MSDHHRRQKHWLWRALDQEGFVLGVVAQEAAKHLFRMLLAR